jgi:hypothetical protein
MADRDYILEKLAVAVDCLAAGFGTIQERLTNAGTSALTRLEAEDFSEDTRTDFEEIFSTLTSIEHFGDEGQIAASAGALTDERARDTASKIVWLMYAVASEA